MFCISASNTFGLFLLILLLGHGLVEIPRSVWSSYRINYGSGGLADENSRMSRIYFKIAKLNGEMCDAYLALESHYGELRQVVEWSRSSDAHGLDPGLKVFLERCLASADEELVGLKNINTQSTRGTDLTSGEASSLASKLT